MATTGAFAWITNFYDAYVTTTIDIPFFEQEVRAVDGPVLELMAGTGRVSLPLARAGADLTCVDLAEPMLARLRAKLDAEGLRAELHAADVARLDLPRRDYALALLPFQSFAELVEVEGERAALARIAAHLRSGGRFVCTLHNPAVRLRSVDGQLRLIGSYPLLERDATLLLWSHQELERDAPIVRATQLYELYDADGLLTEKRRLLARFRIIERAEFEALATGAGFRVETLWGDYARAPFDPETSPFMIWALRR